MDPSKQAFASEPHIPISSVTNENWRGKNDPTERRRIQNRLNQRAYRNRQRICEITEQHQARASEETPPQRGDGSEAPRQMERQLSSKYEGRASDELTQVINRNFMASAFANARFLNLDRDALAKGYPVTTPRHLANVPAALQPVVLQFEVPHDPIIDIIPHPRFRFNILEAAVARQLNTAALCASLRASGGIEGMHGPWRRNGVVVWGSPEQLSSWELSETFLENYGFLLRGCEDLLAATNAWRLRRGERPFFIPSQ